jgi:hypothetical protein
MRHLRDEDIVRLVAHNLPGADVQAVRAHVLECEACAVRVRTQIELWSTLGAWEAVPPVPASTSDLLARLDNEAGVEPDVSTRKTNWVWMGRLAASVLLAVGIGYAVGRWKLGGSHTTAPEQASSAVAEAVDSLDLTVLASAPIGLTHTVEVTPADEAARGGRS